MLVNILISTLGNSTTLKITSLPKITMKSATCVLLITLLTYGIFCNESILSKLHQHDYKIKDFRIELQGYNKKYFNFFQVRTFKYNRTTAAVNVTLNFKIAVQDKAEVVIQAYKFLSNEYRHFPVRFQTNLKKSFDSNAMGFQDIRNCGNIKNAYFEKDTTYHICNYVIDETQFPPLVPNGRYRVNLQHTYLNENVSLLYIFGEVYTPITYPKK